MRSDGEGTSISGVSFFTLYKVGDEMKGIDALKRMLQLYDDILSVNHRTEIARELRDEDDLFLLLCLSETLGLPNPAFYYTLELYPYILEKFHEWHLRMGMEKSPLTGIRCC